MRYEYEDDKHVIIIQGKRGYLIPDLVEYRLVYMKHEYCVRPDVEEWLLENIGDEGIDWDFEFSPMYSGFAYFRFKSKENAMRFKLTFISLQLDK
jgi:hypothetical protein